MADPKPALEIVTDKSGCKKVYFKIDDILLPWGNSVFNMQRNLEKLGELRLSEDDVMVIGLMANSMCGFEMLTDNSGYKFGLLKVDDIYMPVGNDLIRLYNNFGNIGNLQLREDDVLIIGYQKAGTHWMHEMVGMLLKGKAETVEKTKEVFMLDFNNLEDLDKLPSPRILNTHYWPKHIPREFLRRKNVIYLLRNPKDTAVSSYHTLLKFKVAPDLGIPQYAGKFEDYLDWFFEGKVEYGSWFEYVRAWEDVFESDSEIDPIIIHYEDTKKDPANVLKRIAKRIGTPCSDEFLAKVADACHIDKMREANDKREDIVKKVTVDGKSPMYRKGMVGDWKNYFTDALNDKFDLIYREKMKGSKLQFIYEL